MDNFGRLGSGIRDDFDQGCPHTKERFSFNLVYVADRSRPSLVSRKVFLRRIPKNCEHPISQQYLCRPNVDLSF
jgi:hypothetical protein